MELSTDLLEEKKVKYLFDRIEEVLKAGLEKEAIKCCVEGMKLTTNIKFKKQFENIIVSLL